MKTDVLKSPLSERILLLTVSLIRHIDLLLRSNKEYKNLYLFCISISGLHFSTVPNTGFIRCHSSLDQLFVYKIKLNLPGRVTKQGVLYPALGPRGVEASRLWLHVFTALAIFFFPSSPYPFF